MFFSKWHALGNDFVLIGTETPKPSLNVIRAMGDRKTGVGFDQLLVLSYSKKADFKLEFYNADASRAEICGNGLRAAALAIYTFREFKNEVTFETDAGIRKAIRIGKLIEVEMGIPKPIKGAEKIGQGVEIGNPHLVIFTKKAVSNEELAKRGAELEKHKAFKNRTNVEFAQIANSHSVDVQVFERGVGITDACGSGAVAVSWAASENGFLKSPVKVNFKRGEVSVRWNEKGQYFLKGDAHFVYYGKWEPQ